MAKLLLINAGKKYEYGVHEPIHLLFLAAYAKKFGHEVAITDQISGENVFKKIKKFKPDFVGITATTAVISDAYEIADWCRKKGYKTILGGVHVTVMPQEALEHGDFIVLGEGEEALVKILNGETKDRLVKGEFIKNLDSLPKINRDLLNMKYYQGGKERNPGSHLHFVPPNTKISCMVATRGCPFNCIFCHNSWKGLPVRMNSAKHIIEEMKELQNKYGTEAIVFMDDDFLVSQKRINEFCKLYKRENLKIIWSCSARVSAINKKILKKIKEINCKQIMFGLESGNERILGIVKNHTTTVQQNKEAVRLVKESGILACGNFMIGNPTETENEIEDTKKFILENNLDGFGVTISTAFPGTKLWKMCEERGIIPEKIDWRKFNTANSTFNLSEVSYEKLQEYWNYFLDLALEKNAQTTPKNIIKVALKHPKKAIRRIIENPHSIGVIFKRLIKN